MGRMSHVKFKVRLWADTRKLLWLEHSGGRLPNQVGEGPGRELISI